VNGRRTFLLWFVEALAVAGGGFFAWTRGVPQAVWANDASMMTSAIAALFVVTAAWLGWQAWDTDDPPRYFAPGMLAAWQPERPNADFGHLAEGLAVRLGLIGTGIGIVLTIKASLASTNPLSALQTAFFSMICGVAASSIIAVMTYSLESGIRRARR